MQVILCGDFFKLPSNIKDEYFSCMYCGCPESEKVGSDMIRCIKPPHNQWTGPPCGRIRKKFTFCFETPTWYELKLEVVQFTRAFQPEANTSMATKLRRGLINSDQMNPKISIVKDFYKSLHRGIPPDEWQTKFLALEDFFYSPKSLGFATDSQDNSLDETTPKKLDFKSSRVETSTKCASPAISITSKDKAQLISVADAAEKTFSQQQQGSQRSIGHVKTEENDEVQVIDSDSPKNRASSILPEVQKKDKHKMVESDREDIKLKRKAESPLDDVKPQLKRPNMTQWTDAEEKDVKPFDVDPTLDPGSTKFVKETNLNVRSLDVDKKPNIGDQMEGIEISNQQQTSNQGPETPEQILQNLTRRICNSIYRLNKSLLDLPSNKPENLKPFTLENVQDHVNLLVKESFHNLYLNFINTSANTSASGSASNSNNPRIGTSNTNNNPRIRCSSSTAGNYIHLSNHRMFPSNGFRDSWNRDYYGYDENSFDGSDSEDSMGYYESYAF